MGVVYKARDRSLEETVAIKVLRPDFAQDPKMAARFKSEIRLARKVRHKNVCAIHDYGEDRGLLYISMELIEGTDLKRTLGRQGGFRADEAYDVAIQVAEGLQAVHDAGIIHRDLKTSNIMRDAAGIARLMDFGIAKREDERTLTATGHIVGTPEYMSPEQAQAKKVDFRSDVYALGIVTYEIFTGQVPFKGDTPISTILKQLHDPPPLDDPGAARVPRAVKGVLRKALAKDPAERQATALEFAEALRRARSPSRRQELVPTAALEAPTLEAARRRQGFPLVWLLLAAAAVAGGALLVLRTGTLGAPPSAAPTASAAASAPPVFAPSLESRPPTPLASPDLEPRHPTDSAPSPTPPTPFLRATRTSADTARARQTATPAATAAPVPAATPTPTAAPPAAPSAEGTGQLQIAVRPWGEVSVDGSVVGTTPLDRISMGAGSHSIRVAHPAYEVIERRVTIRTGETAKLVVDFQRDGVRKP